MKGLVKPVIAYQEDIDVWIYYDQIDQLCRYEVFCVAYDDSGHPTTLDFVIEEGVIPLKQLPQITMDARVSPPNHTGWIQISDYLLVLSDPVTIDLHISHQLFAQSEQAFKHNAKKRITRKLRALGYDVLHSVAT